MSPTRGNRQRLRGLARSLVPDRLVEARFRRTLARTHGVAVQHESGRQVSGTKFGQDCRLTTPVYIVNSVIGDRSYVEPYTRISNAHVGKFSAIGPACHVGLAQHPSTGYVSTHPVFYRHSPGRGFDFTSRDLREELPTTVVGNDVWIGASVCVKAGVTIGDGAVIGAGAVVTQDVPPYAVCAGVPARVLRYRFDDETVALMRAARWWDRDEDWLREHRAAFEDVTRFLDLVESTDPVDAPPLPPP